MRFAFLLFSSLFYISCDPALPALHQAVQNDDLETVKRLMSAEKCDSDAVKASYDVHIKDIFKDHPDQLAEYEDSPDVMKDFSRKVYVDRLAFKGTCFNGINFRRPVDAFEKGTDTPDYDEKIVLSLLEETPIFHVRSREMAEFLVSQGADVNFKTTHDYTPLHFADNPTIIKFFLDHGADIEAKNQNNRTPLIIAILYGKTKNAEFLISQRANPHTKDNFGHSAHSYVMSVSPFSADAKKHQQLVDYFTGLEDASDASP